MTHFVRLRPGQGQYKSVCSGTAKISYTNKSCRTNFPLGFRSFPFSKTCDAIMDKMSRLLGPPPTKASGVVAVRRKKMATDFTSTIKRMFLRVPRVSISHKEMFDLVPNRREFIILLQLLCILTGKFKKNKNKNEDEIKNENEIKNRNKTRTGI